MRYLIYLILLVGCSHKPVKNDDSNIEKRRNDLDISEELKEKFVITTEKPKTESPKASDKKAEAPPKSSPNQVSKKSVKKPVQKAVVTKKTELPSDYPQNYKDFDKVYAQVWKKFDSSYLNKREKIEMRVSYLGLGMGSMTMNAGEKVFVGDKKAFSFEARLKTADFYSYIYELDDKLSAQIELNEFLPLRYSLIQRESKKEIDDIQLFDREKYLLYYRYRRWRKDKETLTKKSEDIFVPKYALDPFSLLYFVRGLPLSVGQKYEFPVVTRDKLWIFKLMVVDKEEIKTVNGKKMAYKVDAQIGEEGSFIKKGELNLWFGTDPAHILWQLRVGTKIGSLYARIKSIER